MLRALYLTWCSKALCFVRWLLPMDSEQPLRENLEWWERLDFGIRSVFCSAHQGPVVRASIWKVTTDKIFSIFVAMMLNFIAWFSSKKVWERRKTKLSTLDRPISMTFTRQTILRNWPQGWVYRFWTWALTICRTFFMAFSGEKVSCMENSETPISDRAVSMTFAQRNIFKKSAPNNGRVVQIMGINY